MAWNSSNNNLMAAGYRTRPSADSAQAAGTAGGSAFAQGQQGSIVGQGALLSAPRPAAGDAAGGESSDGAAAVDLDGAGGCVALWSLKNQFYPVWSFKTKAGELATNGMLENVSLLPRVTGDNQAEDASATTPMGVVCAQAESRFDALGT
jgi:hypothetical protein